MIICDTREKHINDIKELLVGPLSEIKLPEFQFRCLPIGDYLIINNNNILIERKNINDFCNSFMGLKNRLAYMRLKNERTALLLEGPYHVVGGQVYVQEGNSFVPRMNYKTMCNFIMHQQELGTHFYFSMNLQESILKMVNIHDYLAKLNSPKPSIKCGNVVEWLVQLPGVGPKIVDNMTKNYLSPLDALNNGLPKKAKKILSRW